LLWDIDGTLLRTDGAGMRAMARTGAALYGERFHWKGIEAAGHLDPWIVEQAWALNGVTDGAHSLFHERYIEELRAELERVAQRCRTMPGIDAILRDLRARRHTSGDVAQGLVTGNYARAAELKLRASGIDPSWFELGAFGDEGATRPDLVALALRRFAAMTGASLAAERVVVIGDTPRDIACAHAHGCTALAVATGSYPLEQLVAAGADIAVRDLSDPAPLLALIDRPAP
jgi:phosphoglycolate phosphatase-like HAD superfamily hydrolase